MYAVCTELDKAHQADKPNQASILVSLLHSNVRVDQEGYPGENVFPDQMGTSELSISIFILNTL
ncbi:MAG: hypothetical protein TQ37_06835 [Candidatus Synechococcus spongiarum 15L]|uniref:Uncharacterized protein n=1 Tax=Candidatus Synechococcus spongiarum 15L TaxID=1608419 RepID=A0A0G8ATS4_9SYNE|nr:MAG: hypothetical protein TQ37_06835 [Candidatus Synechococcus spongiarum 15L]